MTTALHEQIGTRLTAAGIPATLVDETFDPDCPDNATVIFQADCLTLRFTRYNGHDFLDIATALAEREFYWFGDIEVAMGWSSLERILSRIGAPPVDETINRLGQHFVDLKKLFFKNIDYFTQARIARTMRRADARAQSLKH